MRKHSTSSRLMSSRRSAPLAAPARRPEVAGLDLRPWVISTARSTAWSSSRTLPGQACSCSARMAPASKPVSPLAVALRVLPQEVLRRGAGCPPGARAAAACGSRWCSGGRAGPAGSGRPPPPACRSALVAERIRTSTRRVFEEPTRSNSPVSRTRSSLGCRFRGTFAISSRKSVPPSASSKRPTRSVLASVKAPLTWPNSSLSKTPSERPPALTVTSGRADAQGHRVQRPRHRPLAGPVLAGDEHVRVGRAHPLDHLQHRLHRRRTPR